MLLEHKADTTARGLDKETSLGTAASFINRCGRTVTKL